MACPQQAFGYNYAGKYTFAARWNESGRTTSGGITTYPEEHLGFSEFDVCPSLESSYMFPSAVVVGNIKQTCANLWKALLESNYVLGGATFKTRARDVSDNWIFNFVNPTNTTQNFFFFWFDDEYGSSAATWDSHYVLRSVYPIVLSGGPHAGESVVGNANVLAFGDRTFVLLDTDGSLSFYWYGTSGNMASNPTATTFTNGSWNGQTLASKLPYMIGFEGSGLYFLEGANTLHVFDEDLKWKRTETVALGHELSGYTMGDLVDNKIPGYTYIGWDVGPIVIGVTALRSLDHIEVTTTSTSGITNSPITFNIKACASANCATLFTLGLSGNITLSDGSSAAFSIAAGNSTTSTNITVTATPGSGYVTASTSNLSVSPRGAPALYCGLGVGASSLATCNFGLVAPVHHLNITSVSSSGISCTPSTFTIQACADATCSSGYTSGMSGNLTFSGVGAVVTPSSSVAFTVPAGSSSTTVSAQVTVVPATTYVTLGTSSLSVTPSNATAQYCGLGVSASSTATCNFTVNTAGLLLSVPHHYAGTQPSLTISAVKQGTSTTSCTPAFANVSKSINIKCGYGNPSSGTLPVRIDAMALNSGNNASGACDGTGQTLSLNFDSTGKATSTLQYADVGQVTLSGAYTGSNSGGNSDGGLIMSGSTSFIAAPYEFEVSRIGSGNIIAGGTFSASVTAKNYNNAATPNFGKESTPEGVTLSFVRAQPKGNNAVNGTFSGTVGGFNAGVATGSNLTWSEVGRGDVSVVLASGNYLGSNLANTGGSSSGAYVCASEGGSCILPTGATTLVRFGASGFNLSRTDLSGTANCNVTQFGGDPLAGMGKSCSYWVINGAASNVLYTGAFGPFIPHHLDVDLTQGCASSFTYSGQPFSVALRARNAAGAITLNYDGTAHTSPNQAQAVTLTAIGAGASTGSLTAGSVSASSFGAGLATLTSTPAFTFTQKLTAPTAVTVRATDANGVSSSNGTDGAISRLLSGRLKLFNAFGSGKTSLSIPVQAQYWNGKAWVINSLDSSCTTVAADAVALSGYVDAKSNATSAWSTSGAAIAFTSGSGSLTLSAPTSSGTGSVDVVLNLGSGSTDQSCQANHPSTTGAALPWLRAQNGSTHDCAGVTTYDRDPSARATFGVYAPETKKVIFMRDIY